MVILEHVFSAKPIDMLAKYVNSSDSDVELQEPYQLLRVCACHVPVEACHYNCCRCRD